MTATTKSKTVVVVGGGLSGLTAARQLLKDGHHAILLDKGRSVGGRCATRRIGLPGAIAVDSGAQFFPAPAPNSTSAFAATVQEWKNAGLLASSEVHLNHLNPPNQPDDPGNSGHIVAVETDHKGGPKRKRFSLARRWQSKRGDPTSQEVHFVPHRKVVTDVAALHNSDVGGMNTLARYLETRILELNGVVEPNTQVTKLEIKDGKWIVKATRHDTSAHATPPNIASDVPSLDDKETIPQEAPQDLQYEADAVILTQPVVQALDLVRKSSLEKLLSESTESQLDRIKYDPCVSMLVHFPKAPAIGPGHPRERILGVHVLNPAAVALAAHQQTTSQGPALTWIGIQSIKRAARPAQLPRSWAENVVVAAQAVGKLLKNADIVGGLAAGSGFLPPPPAAEENKAEKQEQAKEMQSAAPLDTASAPLDTASADKVKENKLDQSRPQKPDGTTPSTVDNSDAKSTSTKSIEVTPSDVSDVPKPEPPNTTAIDAKVPPSPVEEEPHPGGETLVVQGDAVWSARMYEAEDTEIARSMLSEVTKVLDYMAGTPAGQFGESGDAKALRWWIEEPEIVSIKKWKYAYCVAPDEGVIVADGGGLSETESEGAVKRKVHGFVSADVGAPLFFAGDAFGYRLIETHVPGETAQSVPAEHAATVAAVSMAGADGASAAAAAVATASTTTIPAEQTEELLLAGGDSGSEATEPKEEGVTVWSGFGSEVGGRGIEAAILSGAKVASAVSTQLQL